ncbi:retrovirus-related Pol polyprotein from transposon TNT 1-94 [Trichonephila inaurata madagascariensis]|uniref:Retrovirus-related Pol polyprotein from transposon TNT 1-94 n=1 Tax=Trichonephila inaurata madagascariensis TaxID=2747483 RepID=A0A8X6J4L8_9ARAC|nr:retrovirus-related Pol polyprotein from transposon TNT 1-94 [Trichonephila inaurata madagascariensis]
MSTLPSEYFEFKRVRESVPIEERSEKTFKKPERKCYVCRKPGHLVKDCWKKESKPKVEGDAFVCTVEGVPEREVWIADSGASAYMTKHKNYFVDFTQFNSPKPVYVGNSDAIMAYGHGTVNIEIRINRKWERHHLTEVWYFPDISRNLFSISQTLKKGFKFQASKDECSLLRDPRVRMKGVRTVHGLYALEMRVLHPEISAEVCVALADQSLQLWHERLCHQNKAHVRDILSKYRIKSDVKDSKICDGCCYGKQCRRPFGARKQRATTPGELINIDICGPMQQQSLGGAKFYVCFKDDFTKYRRVFFMQSKNEVSKCLKRFLMKQKMLGIWSRRTGPTSVKDKSPYELWFSKEVISIDYLLVFGTECFVHVPQQKRRKWDKKNVKGVFVGYSGEKMVIGYG